MLLALPTDIQEQRVTWCQGVKTPEGGNGGDRHKLPGGKKEERKQQPREKRRSSRGVMREGRKEPRRSSEIGASASNSHGGDCESVTTTIKAPSD